MQTKNLNKIEENRKILVYLIETIKPKTFKNFIKH